MLHTLLLADSFMPFELEFPKSLIATLLGAVFFFVVVIKLMPKSIPLGLPFIQSQLDERKAGIASTQATVDDALADIQRQHDDYAARLKTIELEQTRRIESAVREAETTRASIISEATTTAAQIKRRAEDDLNQERITQRILLRREIVQLTLSAAESSVNEQATDTVQRELISNFITEASVPGKGA